VVWLRERGVDTRTIFEEGLEAESDAAILAHAHAHGRVVLTHDSDFGRLAILRREPVFGIVYLRPGHRDTDFTIGTLRALHASDIDVSPPFIIVAERRGDQTRAKTEHRLVPVKRRPRVQIPPPQPTQPIRPRLVGFLTYAVREAYPATSGSKQVSAKASECGLVVGCSTRVAQCCGLSTLKSRNPHHPTRRLFPARHGCESWPRCSRMLVPQRDLGLRLLSD
jgi:predicted nuclease of predicted toxin-antitoxin system